MTRIPTGIRSLPRALALTPAGNALAELANCYDQGQEPRNNCEARLFRAWSEADRRDNAPGMTENHA